MGHSAWTVLVGDNQYLNMADDSGAGKFVDKQKAREMRGGLGRAKSAYAQEQLEMQKHANKMCKEKVEAYVACSKDKTITGLWSCRGFLRDMEECLLQYENKHELAKRIKAKHNRLAAEATNQ